MSHIAERMQAVYQRIARAAYTAGRDPSSIRLLAVTKTFAVDDIAVAATAGQRAFGENYVQEAVPKIDALRDTESIEWHLIGPLQTNKCALAAAHFSWVHTLDREKIAARLSIARASSLPPLQVCIQVNISGEASKSGVSLADAPMLARSVAKMPQLALRGLMGIAGLHAGSDIRRAQFRALRMLRDELRGEGHELDTLSMGMSADLEDAIAEGATMVRVGSAIFGDRDSEQP